MNLNPAIHILKIVKRYSFDFAPFACPLSISKLAKRKGVLSSFIHQRPKKMAEDYHYLSFSILDPTKVVNCI